MSYQGMLLALERVGIFGKLKHLRQLTTPEALLYLAPLYAPGSRRVSRRGGIVFVGIAGVAQW